MTKAEEQILRQRDAARRQLESTLRQIRYQLDGVERCLESGHSLNHLGELQGMSGRFEAAVGAYARLSEAAALIEGEE